MKTLIIILFTLFAFSSCAISSLQSDNDHTCFKWTQFGDIYHIKNTFNHSRLQMLSGFSTYQGKQNGILYGHKDFTTGIYTFTVVFTRSASNHSQIMQFPDTGNGFQLPIKFGTN